MAEYIEREAAYKVLTDYYHHSTELQHGALLEALYRVPAADVAPRCPHYIRNIHDRGDDSLCEKWVCEVKEIQPVRHGRWIKADSNPLHGDYYCSECQHGVDIGDGEETPVDRGFYYCFNCGCRMDLEETK